MIFCIPAVVMAVHVFPKDVKRLQRTGRDNGQELHILTAVERVNELQKEVLLEQNIEAI